MSFPLLFLVEALQFAARALSLPQHLPVFDLCVLALLSWPLFGNLWPLDDPTRQSAWRLNSFKANSNVGC